MPFIENKGQPNHLKGFWPIFTIILVSMVAGAIIYAFAYGNMIQSETDSISFWPQRFLNQAKPKAKTPVKTTTSKATTTPVSK
jgi:hypothetical protein